MKEALSTAEAARLLRVAVQSVINWVNRGQLKAYRTPGGHRRIEVHDLVEFLRAHQMPIPPELNDAPPKVLVVDDEAGVVRLIVRLLRRRRPDIEVSEALTGFAAGEMVGTVQPDVVLLDLCMPDLDGFEVCRRIKASPATRHIAVIAMTGHPATEAEAKIRRCGATGYLAKPIDADRLIEEIGIALGQAK
ncbi:MAG: response regulator [Phycisphaerae bacterium]|nr:response regulator [Phycisphaerae bacterium]